jgi:hypothetical protein
MHSWYGGSPLTLVAELLDLLEQCAQDGAAGGVRVSQTVWSGVRVPRRTDRAAQGQARPRVPAIQAAIAGCGRRSVAGTGDPGCLGASGRSLSPVTGAKLWRAWSRRCRWRRRDGDLERCGRGGIQQRDLLDALAGGEPGPVAAWRRGDIERRRNERELANLLNRNA